MEQAGSVVDIKFISKGSANVDYSSASEATAAVEQLNGTTIEGNSRFIDVIIGGDRAAERGFRDPAGCGSVFVRGFDFGTTDEQLEKHMSKAGPIHAVHWVNKGNAVVVYKKMAGATKACNSLDNTT